MAPAAAAAVRAYLERTMVGTGVRTERRGDVSSAKENEVRAVAACDFRAWFKTGP